MGVTQVEKISMNSFIWLLVLSFACCSIPNKDDNGMCLAEEDAMNMMRVCHKGSVLGEKANAAMEACAAKVQTRAKKGKGKGKKPNKCSKVDEIIQWADEEYAEEVCLFTEVGWLDNKMNANEELIEADIKTLPAPIAEALNGEEYEACYAMAMEKMANVAPECDSKYSDEDMQKLEELADAIAHTECFEYIFKKSCGSYAIISL